MAATTAAPDESFVASKNKPKAFDANVHHPFVEVVKHATSPLSVALFAFAIAKYGMRHQYRAWRLARAVKQRHPDPPSRTAPPAPRAHPSPLATQTRAYTTASRPAAWAAGLGGGGPAPAVRVAGAGAAWSADHRRRPLTSSPLPRPANGALPPRRHLSTTPPRRAAVESFHSVVGKGVTCLQTTDPLRSYAHRPGQHVCVRRSARSGPGSPATSPR